MAGHDDLHRFVRDALERGEPRDAIREALLKGGWTLEQADAGLARFAPVDFPIPVPKPKPYLSAREAFIYLILFTTLYLTTFHLGQLIFQFVNLSFPDPAAVESLEAIYASIRFSVASLIIAFPIFLLLSWRLAVSIRRDPSKRGSKVRRWLTYMTLFVAAGVIIGDLIALVYGFLGGDLSIRFALKVATVAAIAGGIFGYYLVDLRRDDVERGP